MIIILKKNRAVVRLIEIPSHHLRFWWSGQNMTKNFIKSIKILFLQFVTVDQIFSKWVPFIIAIVTHTIIKWNQPSGAMANLYKWKCLHTSPTYHILVVSEWCLDLKQDGSASDDSSGIYVTQRCDGSTWRWTFSHLASSSLPSSCPQCAQWRSPRGSPRTPTLMMRSFAKKVRFSHKSCCLVSPYDGTIAKLPL